MQWPEFFRSSLESKQNTQSRRRRGGSAPLDHNRLDFGSNDYLDLCCSSRALEEIARCEQLGSGASPVLSGYSEAHRKVELKLSQLAGFEDAVVFSSGYACNLGVLSCLAQENDLILSDSLNHASLIDGCRLSRAKTLVYAHCSVSELRSILKAQRSSYRRVLIVTESVFSMDGDLAPLASLAGIAHEFDCGLVVDEAHAMGIYGTRGSGLVEELGLQGEVLCKLGTLSKAIGAIGGYACGSHDCIEYLVNYCRSYLFSTAPAPAIMHAVLVSLEQIAQMPLERQALRTKARKLRNALEQQGWQLAGNASEQTLDSPIVPILIGETEMALRTSAELARANIYVPAIRPPTVPLGTSRLRISLSIRHNDADIGRLLTRLESLSPGRQ